MLMDKNVNNDVSKDSPISNRELKQKHLRSGDYFLIIAFSSHALLLTELAANGRVEAPLK